MEDGREARPVTKGSKFTSSCRPPPGSWPGLLLELSPFAPLAIGREVPVAQGTGLGPRGGTAMQRDQAEKPLQNTEQSQAPRRPALTSAGLQAALWLPV